MGRLRVGIIGTGRRRELGNELGFAMAYEHAEGFRALNDRCEIVACADIVRDTAEAFAEDVGIPASGIFTDYRAMLAASDLDVVSICTWPHLHAPMVLDSALAGVRAIHCEKPMADTWGAARLMVQECERRGVQLTINHQRRFGGLFRKANELLQSGAIGELVRLEVSCNDLFDWGTHYIDLCGMYSGDRPAEWVMGQIDYRRERRMFGVHMETQAFGTWRYPSGVYGMIATGDGAGLVGVENRLVGTHGVIEIGVSGGPLLRLRRKGHLEWETVDTGTEGLHGPGYIERAIVDTIDALLDHREPVLSGRKALNATEIIFALFESSRRRARIDLPLTIADNPLLAMIEAGDLRLASAREPAD